MSLDVISKLSLTPVCGTGYVDGIAYLNCIFTVHTQCYTHMAVGIRTIT